MTFNWLIIFFVLLFIEIVTVNLVSIWFALGALASLITSMFTDNVVLQVSVFMAVSSISLLLTKPIVKKFSNSKHIPTNLDRVLGKEGEVIKDIKDNSYGEVKVMGTIWTATSKDEISVGEKVKVEKIDGVKLIVSKNKEGK
ncbi:MAG: NfeD family protein [Firmicutes bacterium]|nr:NfeD family protein [Bacillota bacterium]